MTLNDVATNDILHVRNEGVIPIGTVNCIYLDKAIMEEEANESSRKLSVLLYSLGHNVNHNFLQIGTFPIVKSNMQPLPRVVNICRISNDDHGTQGGGKNRRGN